MTFMTKEASIASGRMRFHGASRLAVSMAALCLSIGLAHAQSTVTPEDEYRKLIKISEDIQPLGDTPFGEQISLYDGSLSFRQVDVTLPGTGPTITIAREFNLHTLDERPDQQNRAFGDWDLELPQIYTATANQRNVPGWRVNASTPTAICTSFNAPPSVASPPGDAKRLDWDPQTWWQGYQLRIPGAGSQELLFRDASNTAFPGVAGLTYPIVTKQNWAVGCLAQANNDISIQAFLAVAPDGTKYWLDHLAYRYMPSLTRPLGSSSLSRVASTNGMIHPMATSQDILLRREGRMLATRVEDRFGNWVNYAYSGDLVTEITASDGRHVVLSYVSGTPRVASVTVDGGGAGSRTWNYAYIKSSQTLINTLTTVTQPDGSTWSLDLNELNGAFVDMRTSGGSCDAIGTPSNIATTYTGRITQPSGLKGTFTVQPLRRGRSNVPRFCQAGPNVAVVPEMSGTWASIPDASYSMAIMQRQFSGAGIGTQTWSYVYSPANDSWSQNCGGTCTGSVWTKIVHPDGHAERSIFSNRYDWTESLLQSEEVFDGDVDTSTRRQLFQYGYVNPDPAQDARAGAYLRTIGSALAANVNRSQLQQQFPRSAQVVTRDGDTYTSNVTSFDAFARPKQTQRYNSIGYGVAEQTLYQDDYAHWVLGLPLQSDNLTTGEQVSRNVYDPNSLTLSERYHFGRKVMGYTFNPQGQLASFTDGNGKTTTLGNYKRGIPQAIGYPDGTSQSLSVDDFGQIASITNQAGATTSYGYTEIGRLGSIAYPTGDSVAWNTKTFGYLLVSASERGINGPHWRRSISQGGRTQYTYFDAMLRPIISDTYRSDGALVVSTRTDYDWKGRKTFESYPYEGALDPATMNYGVLSVYDSLGRPIQSFQHSELGDLLTKTEYLSGAAKRVTDPKNNATTTWYQVFDQPSYDNVVRVEAPESVLQVIQRDVYGNPQWIQQSGAGQSVTKSMFYDSEHRLCRTQEPESGSEIMAYDGANNLAWSVSGASFNGAGCGQDQVTDTAKTVRAYDAMNRVTSVVYPTGTEPSTFTYDALGNPATATSGTVAWTFGRNKLGLLTAEVLAVDGWSWALGYGYDPNGALSTVLYPDGEVVPYNPDSLGRPTTVGGYANGVTYFPDGDVKAYSLGSGALYSADKNGRNLLHNFTFGKAGAPNVSEDFAYDANGNVSQITDVAGSNQRTKVMGYDALNRLVSATASNLWGTESYTYDTLNNIRSLTNSSGTNTYNYDPNNLLASITNNGATVHAFQYDARGNTTSKDGGALNFDQANRLTSIPGKGTYTYDAAGRRVKKVTPSATTYYAYNSAGQLMWEYDNATTGGTDYIYLGKKLVANSKGPTSKVIGNLDGVNGGANATVVGWACSTGLAASIDVHLYANGPSGVGTAVGAYHANVASEPAIQAQCHAAGTAYRFVIALTEANRIQFAGQPLYVHGISPVGGESPILPGSGSFSMPPSVLAPNAPTSASAAVTGDLTTINVAWAASGTATSYSLDQQYQGGVWATYYNGPATSIAVANPADGAYNYRVKACNTNGCSNYTPSNGVTVAHIPGTPGSISIPASSTGSVGVSWPAVTYATSYQLEHSNDGNWTPVYNGGATSATINETVTSNWYYRVKACNANGCGGYATSSYVSVILPPTAPPTLYGGGTSNDGTYSLSWSGTPGATVYNLIESANGGAWQQIQYGTAGSWSTSGKANGTYVYMVQGCNGSGCTAWSNQVSETVSHIPPVPSARIDMQYTSGKKFASYTMYWDPTPYATSFQIIRYPDNLVIYNTNGQSFWLEKDPSPYFQEFTYAIRACNAVGCSDWTRRM